MSGAHFSKSPIISVAGLREVWASVDACLARSNAAGAVFQLVRATEAAPQFVLDCGHTVAAWAPSSDAICSSAADFPRVLFEKWCSLLHQVGALLPYEAENWQNVLGVLTESSRQLAGSGMDYGDAAEHAQHLVAAHLAACSIQDAAGRAATALAPQVQQHQQQQQVAHIPGGDALQQQQQQEPAGEAATGRSKRRAALATQAVFLAAGDGEGELAASSAAEDQENVLRPRQQLAGKGATAAVEQKALQPLAQQPSATKRQRY